MNDATSTSGDVEFSGRTSIDTIASQRAAENPPDRDRNVCDACRGTGGPNDLWRATWTYFFVPNRALEILIPVATAMGLAFFHNYTRRVNHRTYHVICGGCASTIRRDRVLGFLLRFVGLFAGLCGLALTLAAACWWFIANAHDRQMILTWIAVPVVMLLLGGWVAGLGSRLTVPRVIRSMRRRPFHLTSMTKVGNGARTA
jgi:hypothetical protein